MPLSASALRSLANRFAKKGMHDVGDSFAIAASCAHRGDFIGRELWIETATEKMFNHGISMPSIIESTYLRDLAA